MNYNGGILFRETDWNEKGYNLRVYVLTDFLQQITIYCTISLLFIVDYKSDYLRLKQIVVLTCVFFEFEVNLLSFL